MKSVIARRHGGPEVLELIEEPVPAIGPGEVLVRARAMSVSAPDMLIRSGTYHWCPPLPVNPGNELTGVVDAVGEGVADLRVGQLVLLSSRELTQRGGCYTELRRVPAAALHALPDGIDLERAVVIPTYVVAHAMLKSVARPGMRSIFVNGVSGIIGGALTELAKAQGLTVIGSVGSDAKAQLARARGVDHIIHHRTESLLERVMHFTAGRGVDVAFDHIIGPRFIDCIRMLADFGTVIAYNVHTPMPDEDVFAALRANSIRSPALRVFNIHTYDHDLKALRALTRELIDMLAAGAIHPTVGARIPLAEARSAHELFERGQANGKIILVPEA